VDFAAIGDWHPALPPCEIENVFLTTAPIVAGAGGVPAPAAAWRACLPGFPHFDCDFPCYDTGNRNQSGRAA
jgi:hypothetical protein